MPKGKYGTGRATGKLVRQYPGAMHSVNVSVYYGEFGLFVWCTGLQGNALMTSGRGVRSFTGLCLLLIPSHYYRGSDEMD